uniref:Embryonic stem cell-specific 5-hydroxymethylcytosine-binding protein n=1 Tax=Guillardia theta TaxID=55529 RepID=A0A7S4U9K0_GUITH|mmetsp:Transcript_43921/g.138649  ORF Transcript_43921/g.138649 Transcript_43921/m.138649 type:complete len:453 (+) Transcript_43921:285-1643(+)
MPPSCSHLPFLALLIAPSALGCGRVCCKGPPSLPVYDSHLTSMIMFKNLQRYNCGPGHFLPVLVKDSCDCDVKEEGAGYVIQSMRWGLVPSYTRASSAWEAMRAGYAMINARSDNLVRVHKRLLNKRRCVVVIDGFYEWLAPGLRSPLDQDKSAKSQKRPFFIQRADGKPLCLAGLYDVWEGEKPEDGEKETKITSCTIITTESSNKMSWLHDRMPAILEGDQIEAWLDAEANTFESVQAIIRPYSKELKYYEVADIVNNVKNNVPECLLPLSSFKEKQRASGIASYFKSPVKGEGTCKVEVKEETKKRPWQNVGKEEGDEDKPLDIIKREIANESRETLKAKTEGSHSTSVKQEVGSVQGGEHRVSTSPIASPMQKRTRRADDEAAEAMEVIDLTTVTSARPGGGRDRKEDKDAVKKEKRQSKEGRLVSPSKEVAKPQKTISSYFTIKTEK